MAREEVAELEVWQAKAQRSQQQIVNRQPGLP